MLYRTICPHHSFEGPYVVSEYAAVLLQQIIEYGCGRVAWVERAAFFPVAPGITRVVR